MTHQRYPEEFKIDAVKQVTEKGKPVAEAAQRLGMSVHGVPKFSCTINPYPASKTALAPSRIAAPGRQVFDCLLTVRGAAISSLNRSSPSTVAGRKINMIVDVLSEAP